jgi:hypothetical protein
VQKVKNQKHKESVKRKQQSSDHLGQIGLSLNDEILHIGVIFENLGLSQQTYFGLGNINEVCRDFVGIDINVFYQHNVPPCFVNLFPIFPAKYLLKWENPLIATTLSTCINALESQSKIIYYYMFDLDFLCKNHIEKETVTHIFTNPRIKIITRCADYKNLVEQYFNTKINNEIITDFDIKEFIKLIIKDIKNENKST